MCARLTTILLLALCALNWGCGAIVVFDPQGHVVAAEMTLAKNVGFRRFTTTQPNGSTTITGGTAAVDDAAVQAITAGVVQGVLRGMKP